MELGSPRFQRSSVPGGSSRRSRRSERTSSRTRRGHGASGRRADAALVRFVTGKPVPRLPGPSIARRRRGQLDHDDLGAKSPSNARRRAREPLRQVEARARRPARPSRARSLLQIRSRSRGLALDAARTLGGVLAEARRAHRVPRARSREPRRGPAGARKSRPDVDVRRRAEPARLHVCIATISSTERTAVPPPRLHEARLHVGQVVPGDPRAHQLVDAARSASRTALVANRGSLTASGAPIASHRRRTADRRRRRAR